MRTQTKWRKPLKKQKIYENPEKMALAIERAKTLLDPWKS